MLIQMQFRMDHFFAFSYGLQYNGVTLQIVEPPMILSDSPPSISAVVQQSYIIRLNGGDSWESKSFSGLHCRESFSLMPDRSDG
jgi:hypothetical protein